MKKNKSLLKTQRKSLDEKLLGFSVAKTIVPPKAGWVRAIREAIGMTTAQLAARMGIQQSGVTFLEQREVAQTISLDTLARAARAMNCELVYAIVPQGTLEKIVEDQAEKSAKEILSRTIHTMELELQKAESAETEFHQKDLALDIQNKLDKRLWG